jgi:hypothetical protein
VSKGADGLHFDGHPGLTFQEVCPKHATGLPDDDDDTEHVHL